MDKLILIIEDDPAIVRLLNLALKTSGYNSIVAENCLNGISLFLANHPDCILLDLGLPDLDGFEAIEQVRKISQIPIIVISARSSESEKVKALDAGANDYVTKPFNVAELMARVRVCLRNTVSGATKTDVFVYEDLTVNFDKYQVLVNNSEVHLTPIEFKLLKLLIENKGKVLTHSFIQNFIWGYPSEDDYQSLRVYMTTLRRKLNPENKDKSYILTEIGIGYRFNDK